VAQRDTFSIETTGLPEASSPSDIHLKNGDHLDLRIAPVVKQIGETKLRMLAYNGSIPGPTFHVDQGCEIAVDATPVMWTQPSTGTGCG
jgi:hypothetical protein